MKLRQKPKYFMVSCKNTVCTVHMVYKYVHTVGYWYLFREKRDSKIPRYTPLNSLLGGTINIQGEKTQGP